MEWRKTSRSNSEGNCVEVAVPGDEQILVRDSKDRTGPVLVFNRTEWTAFVGSVKDGEFDLT